MFIVFYLDLNIVWEKSHGGPEYAKSVRNMYENPHPPQQPLTSPPSLLSADVRPKVLQKPPVFLRMAV